VASLFLTTETSRALWHIVGIALAPPGVVAAAECRRGLVREHMLEVALVGATDGVILG
jgi:hypothetical protein